MPYLAMIDKFYRREHIHSQDFACVKAPECSAEAEYYGKQRQEAKASFIGSRYGAAGFPRLVFLSLDPGNNDHIPNDEQRTPVGVQQFYEGNQAGPVTLHWRFTHLFALRLFNEIGLFTDVRDAMFAKTGGKYDIRGKALSALVRPVLPYFCHVNSAKCGANQNGKMAQAPGGFFVKCRPHVKPEIRLLNPAVIVTQGVAASAVLEEMDSESGATLSPTVPVESSNPRIRHVWINGREVLWLKTTHPAAKNWAFPTEGCTCGSRNCWCEYARAFADAWSLHGALAKSEREQDLAQTMPAIRLRSPAKASLDPE